MIKNKVILIDVDDVTADLVSAWLMLYNKKYHDNLRKNQITDWNIAKFVKPECGAKIYEWIDTPEIYDIVKPIKNSLSSINILRENNNRVVFVTASTIGSSGRKFRWLNDNGFNVSIGDYVEAHDKSLINGDIMLDDGIHNCENTSAIPYLFTQSWNRKYQFDNRVLDWNDFMNKMENL
ncbi:MAG: hypothetical protein KBG38_08100 [Candidatus Cloacimonas sp.]|jgi:5'(3')-deoxyribonucleotidase|nr:hypothetical protein [Candidatus Cloacimonas sp.]